MGARSLVAATFLAWVVFGSAYATDLSDETNEALIDQLAGVDAPAPGLHPTAWIGGFIGDDTATRFGGGILGSEAPTVPPAMRELVRRGVTALPALMAHLGDARPTKLWVGGLMGDPGVPDNGGLMFQYFAEEYDPRERPAVSPRRCVGSCISPEELSRHGQDGQYSAPTKECIRGCLAEQEASERSFDGRYNVRIGDVSFAIIGQIINRNLSPVRYQPTAGLVINSPVERPTLAEHVRHDWRGLTPAQHRQSLQLDIARADAYRARSALARLRFYYPNAYRSLEGEDGRKRDAFEAGERAEQARAPVR